MGSFDRIVWQDPLMEHPKFIIITIQTVVTRIIVNLVFMVASSLWANPLIHFRFT